MGGCVGAKKEQIRHNQQHTLVNPQTQAKVESRKQQLVQSSNLQLQMKNKPNASLVNLNGSKASINPESHLQSKVARVAGSKVVMNESRIIKEEPQSKQNSIGALNMNSQSHLKKTQIMLESDAKPFNSNKQMAKDKKDDKKDNLSNSQIQKQSQSQIRKNPYVYTPPPSDLKDNFNLEQLLEKEPGIEGLSLLKQEAGGVSKLSGLKEKSVLTKINEKESLIKQNLKQKEVEVVKKEEEGAVLVEKKVDKSVYNHNSLNLPAVLPQDSTKQEIKKSIGLKSVVKTKMVVKEQIKQELVYDENPQELPKLQLAVYKSKMGISFIR